MPLTLEGVDHVHVYVADRAAATTWYERVLHLAPMPELAFWAPDGGPLTIVNATGTVHLALFERPAQTCRSTVAFGVGAPAFLAWREHLGTALGRPLEPVDHAVSWSMYFTDPDGNPYEITTYDHAAVAKALDLLRG